MIRVFISIVVIFFSNSLASQGTNVFGLGIYDIKFDGSEKNQATDFRYEYRSDKSLLDISQQNKEFFV